MIGPLVHSDFDRFLSSYDQELLLVDFWTTRCEACRHNAAVADELSRLLVDRLDVGKVNVDDDPNFVGHYQIAMVPCLALFAGSNLMHKFYGVQSVEEVVEFIAAVGGGATR